MLNPRGRSKAIPLTLALAVSALFGTSAIAGTCPTDKVVAKDGQKAAQELDAKAAPKRKTLESKQNEINSLKDQLQKGMKVLFTFH